MKNTIKPIPFSSVCITGGFWEARQRANRERTIPIEYKQCKDTGRIDAFRLNWKSGDANPPHIFWDSDVAKWIEAASYSLATNPDADLEILLDEVIELIAGAQQADGYLNVHFTVVEPQKRWQNLRDWHELYCAGHMIEAGVAHFQATGKRTLLDVVCRYADNIGEVIGRNPGQKRGYPGHEEIELALVKLYQVTGQANYLDLARYFVDERGQQPYYFDQEAIARGEDPANFWGARGLPDNLRYAYTQAHLPVRQQNQVMGHAVRAMYLYSAMADVAKELDDPDLMQALEALWEDVCLKKMYITGGIGPSRHNEGFTQPYDLPNLTAYAETCAAIGLVFWNQRMLQLDCDRRYADVMEEALYNGVLSGVSLDGEKFFYENPLASQGNHHRQAWFDCACCPPNIARLLASLGGYIYSQKDDDLIVHLFIDSTAKVTLDGQEIQLEQKTTYPWTGDIELKLEMEHSHQFCLKLRFPGWCRRSKIWVNNQPVSSDLDAKGYICLDRLWEPGDVLRYELEMPIERVRAHPNVRENIGKIAFMRGPLVYCLEQADHPYPIHLVHISANHEFSAHINTDLLGGVVILQGKGLLAKVTTWDKRLYSQGTNDFDEVEITAIPYYAWDNRQSGAMQVWLPEVL